jgi:superfamily II DNA/RNA helicase
MTRTARRPRTAPHPTRRTERRPTKPRPEARTEAPTSDLERGLAAALAVEPADLPTSFTGVGLPAPLVAELTARGVTAPFPIQARTLSDGLAGRDVLGRARTGSGKTLAFGLPLLTRLAAPGPTRRAGAPRGLVLLPTRELAQQVTDALAPLAATLRLRVTAVYGGASMQRQITALRRGADVVVATPGRLLDLIEQGECRLDQVAVTVLDEADYMADLGFLPAVTTLLDMTPSTGQRMLFSATLDRGVDRIVRRYLTEPACHAAPDAGAAAETMDHRVFTLRAEDKVAVAAEVAARPGRTLIFVRTKHGADRLARQLRTAGVPANALHGNLAQNARQRALDGFADGSPRVLVATDVAARGIHVDDVDLVMHFDPPADHKDYLHRSGRTARAGASGTVVSLVLPEQVGDVARLHRAGRVEAATARVRPGDDTVRAVAVSGTPVVVRTSARPDRPGAGGGGHAPAAGRGGGRRRPRTGQRRLSA